MTSDLDRAALEYHRLPKPGKLEITPTKPLATQRDLALAYSPGVAAACRAIIDDPAQAAELTGRGNLIGVISNGTAVLGLGNIGPLASKPVMEGKAVLFKKFAGVDVFDIEINETDPDKLVEIIAALEPTFGGINLEDIKSPECFVVERKLRERMNIPVFHDDQHGTAITVAAAILNGLRVVEKKIEEVRLVASGAGAAALACLDLLVALGMKKENIVVTDIVGVVYEGRTEQMDEFKARYARATNHRTLADAIVGADVFLGLSAANVLKPEMVKQMGPRPLILALANPTPEILPEVAKAARPDVVMATGRSDYPNQVNNVLCFPFLFRGALDVGATTINTEMELAAVRAIADLAMAEISDIVARAYGADEQLSFGPEYFIPKPFDPRLILQIAPAVAKAAMDSGVATRPIADLEAYRESLERFVYRTGFVMRPTFERAKRRPMRLIYAEGEDERVLRAAQIVLDDKLAQPTLIGRRSVVEHRIKRLGLRLKIGENVQLIDPERDDRYTEYWTGYLALMKRKGVAPDDARIVIRTNTTVIAAMAVHRGEADAMICGAIGQFEQHLPHIMDVIGLRPGAELPAAMQLLVLPQGMLFIADSNVNFDPTTAEIVAIARLAAEEVRRFGLVPKIALLSHSNFGSAPTPSSRKMREAVQRLQELLPDIEIEGEMKADAAVSEAIRDKLLPDGKLRGAANLLVMPNLDAANIAANLVRQIDQGFYVGPILMGMAKSAHIVSRNVTVRGLVNMSAVAVVDAQDHADGAMGQWLKS
ncbi:NADP-dependent malic enzyme [uncultured Ferrovibrio sp.]|jgi:malate dehydrogenase (oxaloacetate-decarboxylating)(NADP+)|uniref:NADP-dependent malic enzyme n=1 Tax=uncultured Ferrovibrio sp. TaxID=1576913 RepID=UPI002617A732|nr:NADP-dependent malic enzyme [uncultured Ferrovibrio sp.]